MHLFEKSMQYLKAFQQRYISEYMISHTTNSLLKTIIGSAKTKTSSNPNSNVLYR